LNHFALKILLVNRRKTAHNHLQEDPGFSSPGDFPGGIIDGSEGKSQGR
jgi:hypothetical protein